MALTNSTGGQATVGRALPLAVAALLAGCGDGATAERSADTPAAVESSAANAPDVEADGRSAAAGRPDAHQAPSAVEKPMPAGRTTPAAAGPDGSSFWNLGAGSRTVLALDPKTAGGTALFLCDSLDRPQVLALTVPDAERRARLVTIPKADRPPSARAVTVGRGDPGAGNIYYPLTVDGRDVGLVHAINTGILPDQTTPGVSSVKVGDTTHGCRWAPNTRVLAVTPRRTVLVTGRVGQGQLRYRTFNDGATLAPLKTASPERGTEASLDLTGGRERGGVYAFRNEGYEYRLDPGAATLTVARDGKVIQTETLLAWTVGGGASADR